MATKSAPGPEKSKNTAVDSVHSDRKLGSLLRKTALVACVAGAVAIGKMDYVPTEVCRLPYIREALDETGIYPDQYRKMTATEVVRNVNTWDQAESYLMGHFRYSDSNKGYPEGYTGRLSEFHAAGKGNCSAAADIGCMLMNRTDRYEGQYVSLYRRSWMPKINPILLDHAICLVKDTKTGKFGSLGINRADCIPPVYDSKGDILRKINRSFLGIFDLSKTSKEGHAYFGKI